MSEDPTSDRLRDLGARLSRIREEKRDRADRQEAASRGAMSGFGMAMRIGTELVAGLVVGVGIGYLLDRWLGTAPWFLVVFFFLGSGAGILNVYRSASSLGTAPQDKTRETKISHGAEGSADGAEDDDHQRRDG